MLGAKFPFLFLFKCFKLLYDVIGRWVFPARNEVIEGFLHVWAYMLLAFDISSSRLIAWGEFARIRFSLVWRFVINLTADHHLSWRGAILLRPKYDMYRVGMID